MPRYQETASGEPGRAPRRRVVEWSTKRCARASFLIQWVKNGEIPVTPAEAKELGALLREQRKKLGLSTHQLGAQAGMRQSTITRVEQGMFASPRPDKLARIAGVLGLSLADLYARAGYFVPDELPSFHVYLPAKYRQLPPAAVAQLVELFHELAAKHDMPVTDPALSMGGADE